MYKLNPFAYTCDISQSVTGLVRVRETIKVSHDGTTMTGTSVLDIYDAVRNLLQTVNATLVGSRIEHDTTAQEIRQRRARVLKRKSPLARAFSWTRKLR